MNVCVNRESIITEVNGPVIIAVDWKLWKESYNHC